MLEDLKKLEKLINSELTSKVQKSSIENHELLIETNDKDLVEVVQFLKSNEKCKFRQLIDIAGVDYPDEEKRFQLVYLFLSHENNLRIKILLKRILYLALSAESPARAVDGGKTMTMI